MQFFRYHNEPQFNEGTFPFSMNSTQGIILQFNFYYVGQLFDRKALYKTLHWLII